MSRPVNYYKIGVFVVIGIIIILLLVIGLGSSQYFQRKYYMETYFNESVQGLQKGSPVKYEGIQIGQVNEVKLLSQVYSKATIKDPKIYRRYIYVKISISNAQLEKTNGFFSNLDGQIKKGLRIRLASESITGGTYLELSFMDPKTNPYFKPSWKTNDPYLPSTSSTISKFIDAMGNVFVDLQNSHLDKLSHSATKLMTTTTNAIKQANVKNLSQSTVNALKQIQATAKSYNTTAEKLDKILAKAPIAESVKGFNKLAASLNKATVTAEKTLALLNKSIQNSNALLSTVQSQSTGIMNNLNGATQNIQTLSANAKEYPSQVLFGQAPPHLDPGAL